ncbi:hypothetical protein GH714_031281 [Hevea brasiliensis]|uniref:Uncharacterized protein n=1 Tax=Hevea brasiliensis TaxID=3981 RepID=A0A6A6N5B6_HEVBR|nr:hypothetical protein GH714_031281 [Hevea brasiliensis]
MVHLSCTQARIRALLPTPKDFFNSHPKDEEPNKNGKGTEMEQDFIIEMQQNFIANTFSVIEHSKEENTKERDEWQVDNAMGKTGGEYEMKVLCSMIQRMILSQLEMEEVFEQKITILEIQAAQSKEMLDQKIALEIKVAQPTVHKPEISCINGDALSLLMQEDLDFEFYSCVFLISMEDK